LRYHPFEHPVALQLGGSEPEELAACAAMAEARGFDEVNLNCGCPSDRVQKGRFGACLMATPDLVAGCVAAMRQATRLPVTVKCRIGIDDCEEAGFLARFVETVADAGCGVFIVHARKAWLQGLSPKENREIPPLRYELVRDLKRRRRELTIVLNGGLRTPEAALAELAHVDGVMIGRAAYEDPWRLRASEEAILGPLPALDRHAVVTALVRYAGHQMATGVPLKRITRHVLGLFNEVPGARAWRRMLSEGAHAPDAEPGLLLEAARRVQPVAAAAA
jgi:tRNA-dihydrouridine synthase A